MTARRSRSTAGRHARAALVLAGVVWAVTLVGVTGVVGVGVPAGVAPAIAQEADRAPGEPCLPGVTSPPPGQAPNGPSPVGRCEPTTARRALDNAVWAFTLACLVGVVVLGVVLVRRDRRDGATPSGEPADGSEPVDGAA